MHPEIPKGTDSKLYAEAMEFMKYSYDLLAAYLDALAGVYHLREEVIRIQEAKISKICHSDPENACEVFMDQQSLSHELEATSFSESKVLHRSTQGEFKQRSTIEGVDARFLGCMAITLLYGAWEEVYRERLAIAAGHTTKNQLNDDLFGDLASLRHAIVHNNGQATSKVENSKILRWFKRDQTILVSTSNIDFLMDKIDVYLTGLCGLKTLKRAQNGFSWSLVELSKSTAKQEI